MAHPGTTASVPSAAERTLPHDLKVERAILSAMLREPRPCVDEAIEQLGENPDAFYLPVHRLIYSAFLELNKNTSASGIDMVMLGHHLEKQGRLDEIGGAPFLAELYGEVPTTVNLESWCRVVRDFSTLRRLIGVCSTSLNSCYNRDLAVSQVVDQVETDVYNVRNQSVKSSVLPIQEVMTSRFDFLYRISMNEVEGGISTGYKLIDDITGGLKPGEMFVLAARPSIGKTAFALNIVSNIVLAQQRPRRVAFFSLEMTAEQIAERLMCSEARISASSFWNHTFDARNLPRITKAVAAYKSAKLFVDPTAGLTIADLRAKARRLKMTENIELVVIDYLQLMGVDARIDSRQQQVSEISSGIKKLAKELNIPVLVLAQLNRESEKTTAGSTEPKLSQLRESGAIEQDADIVAFLHRNRDEAKKIDEGKSVEAKLIVEKNRNGRIGVVDLLFFPSYTRFEIASKYENDARED